MSTAKIDFTCLCYVAERPSSGYDILRATHDGNLRMVLKTSQPAVYDSLRRLHTAGALYRETIEQAGKPDKHLYSLTAQGRHAIPEYAWKIAAAKPADEATVLLLARFRDFIPPQAISVLVETYISAISAEIEELSLRSAENSSEFREVLCSTMISVLNAKIRFAKAVSSAAASTAQR